MLIGLLALSGCSNWIVGDSITYLSTARILQGNPATRLDADMGRGAHSPGLGGMPDGWTSILSHIDDVPVGGWFVVQLGTNDLTRSKVEWQLFVAGVVDRLADDRCLAWVTPYNPEYQGAAATYAALVTNGVRRQPCHAVIRWDEVARMNPALTTDGYHPNDRGSAALACMLDSVLYNSCRSTGPITRD